jgi:hypothetical protein
MVYFASHRRRHDALGDDIHGKISVVGADVRQRPPGGTSAAIAPAVY